MTDLEAFALLDKGTLFEETHESRGRIMEYGGFYYAEAKDGDEWLLVQYSAFPQVARMALDHYLADENLGLEELRRGSAQSATGQPRVSALPLAGRRICPTPIAHQGEPPEMRGLTT